MTRGWIGMRDATGARGAPAVTHPDIGRPDAPDHILPRGTLMVEVHLEPRTGTRNLVRLSARDPWPVGLTLTIGPDGTFGLMQTQGQSHRAWRLGTDITGAEPTVIVTFVWDGPARRGSLSVHVPGRDAIFTTALAAPLPLTLRDAQRLMDGGPLCRLSSDLRWLAVADRPVPAGPMPVLGASAAIETPRGMRAVGTLRCGDTVLTCKGKTAQVRWTGAVELPALGHFAPLLLRAPYLRVHSDLVVSRDARLVLRGSEVDYLFGHETVSARVCDLVDGRSVRVATAEPTVVYHHLVLDDHAAFLANGAAIESLDVAPLLDCPAARAVSMIAEVPMEILPRGPRLSHPLLRTYEATTLRRMRAA